MMKFDARTVAKMRAERRWTLAEVAKRANCSPRTVLYVERGFSQPRANTLAGLAHAFECPMETFFRGAKKDEAA